MLSISFCQSINTVDEDEIIQKIQLDQPSDPVVRSGMNYVNLFGKWCYVSGDSSKFTLQRVADSTLVSGCNGLRFHYFGEISEELQGDFFRSNLLRYEIQDSVLFIRRNAFERDEQINQYFIYSVNESEIVLEKLPLTQDFFSIFGVNEHSQMTISLRDVIITYSEKACQVRATNLQGEIIWTLNLGDYSCQLIYFEALDQKYKGSDIILQSANKQMFGLNSKNGRLKKINPL